MTFIKSSIGLKKNLPRAKWCESWSYTPEALVRFSQLQVLRGNLVMSGWGVGMGCLAGVPGWGVIQGCRACELSG